MYLAALVLGLLTLLPLILYLAGKIKDPFNPLIFVGLLAFGIAVKPVFMAGDQLEQVLNESTLTTFIVITILSMLGLYFGWYLGGRKPLDPKSSVLNAVNPAHLLIVGIGYSIIGASAFLLTYQNYTVTGYLRDLTFLWITGAVLICQAFVLSSSNSVRMAALLFAPIALLPPIDRFLVYGQRGDLFRILAILSLLYLMKGKRPTRPVFVMVMVSAALTLSTLHLTREVMADGLATNRFNAIWYVIPQFFEKKQVVDTGEEIIFASAGVQAVRDTGRYGNGLGLTLGLVQRFAPKEIFPSKWSWFRTHAGYDQSAIREATGRTISGGAAPTGFAHAFFELGWFAPLAWVLLGYFGRRVWRNVELGVRVESFGYYVAFLIVLLYVIAQDFLTGEVNLIYTFPPLYVAYRIAGVNRKNALAPDMVPA